MGDRYKNTHMGSTGFGRTGGTITPDDAVDLPDVAKAVTVTDAGGGTLQILPVDNPDGQWITITGVTTGYIPPYQIRRIGIATDCTVISVGDRSPGLVSLVPGLGREINPSPNLDDASIWNLKSGWTIAADPALAATARRDRKLRQQAADDVVNLGGGLHLFSGYSHRDDVCRRLPAHPAFQ